MEESAGTLVVMGVDGYERERFDVKSTHNGLLLDDEYRFHNADARFRTQ